MMNVIIHHAGCFDGICAAWVCLRALRARGEQDFQIYAASYGDIPPDVKGSHVFIVDFSYPRETMDRIFADAAYVTVLDHHKTAEAALKDLKPTNGIIVFDMERSGAGIAWDFFYPHRHRPWLVDAVEDRDLWRFKFVGTKSVIAYLASQPLTVESFDETSELSYAEVIQRGLSVLDYIKTFGSKVIETWTIQRVGGYEVPLINTPYMNSSDFVDMLMDKLPGHPFYGYFFMKHGRWQFGLRSRGDFDVSEIAKIYGGGGHKNASGFTVDYLPWMPQFMTGNN